jgi:CRP-like cAMP-binding protein
MSSLYNEGEGGIFGESAEVPPEDLTARLRTLARVVEARLFERMGCLAGSGLLTGAPDLLQENALLRSEVEGLKARIEALEARIPEERVVVLTEVSREDAKRQIRELFATGHTLYYSDIAWQLGLDLEMVVDICNELEATGEIHVDDSVS